MWIDIAMLNALCRPATGSSAHAAAKKLHVYLALGRAAAFPYTHAYSAWIWTRIKQAVIGHAEILGLSSLDIRL